MPIVNINELGGLGDGFATHEGRRIVVPYTMPGDTVSIEIKGNSKDIARGSLVEIVTPSKERKPPVCRHFSVCGGCSLQHLPDNMYATLKQQMLQTAVSRAGYDPSVVLPIARIPANTRRRAIFKVSATRQEVNIGYYEASSHVLLPIDECPLLTPEIWELIPELQAVIPKLAHPEDVTEISITLSDTGLDVIIITDPPAQVPDTLHLTEFAETHDISRISWHWQKGITTIVLRRPVQLMLGDIAVTLPVRYFLQATKEGQMLITSMITEATKDSAKIIDLYAGCGTYSFPMSAYAHVNAVEGDVSMIHSMQNAISEVGLKQKLLATHQDLFRQPYNKSELSSYDAAVINPPRNGAETQMSQLAQSRTPIIVMVSCNPNSFQRDAGLLRTGGYKLEKALAIDQFLWSSHLEIVAVFTKN